MSSNTPPHVVCAVRGGPESRETVSQAIDLALSLGARLTFFRVIDAEFMEHATIGPLSVVYRELREMSYFALMILCDRAQRRGVKEVELLVREGNIRRQLRLIATEPGIDVLVLGRPVRSPGSNVFKPAEFDTFVQELKQESDLRIEVITPSED
ncbi:MAG: universal stress protein [Anaerolineae bacterium]|jgi:nucleotide-binding universal stress UspA family protein